MTNEIITPITTNNTETAEEPVPENLQESPVVEQETTVEDIEDEKFGISNLSTIDSVDVGDDSTPEQSKPLVLPDPPKSILKKSQPEEVVETKVEAGSYNILREIFSSNCNKRWDFP